uniref:Uncharacterized protein n=1 Tax=Myotis myotis TaxID=51298 RepID=A0A7J7ZYP3_MYOMY|nr:hypothetical protein mMyoMyo1_009995 [Myotis myotis]
MEALMGEGLASSEGLVRTTGCRSPLRAQKGPEKGPAAVSDSEGRLVLSSGPRLLLLPSCCEPWTPRTLVDAWCRTPLSATGAKLPGSREERWTICPPFSRDGSGARRASHGLLLVSRHDKTVWYASHMV